MLLDLKELQKKYNAEIKGVIHIGAHTGEEHSTYIDIGINKLVYFEPLPHIFEKLVSNVKDSNVIFHNCALGNDNTKIGMYVEKNDRYGCSSILKPSKNYDRVPFLDEKVFVDMKKLDTFNFGKEFNMLNIDVQGYELEVLKGSTKTLENIDYIMCEINRSTEKKGIEYINCALVGELQKFLINYEFKLVEQNWAGTSWGDGFFIRGNLL
jgi:FkbM family methyltransferase